MGQDLTCNERRAEKSKKHKYRVSKPSHKEQVRSLVEVQMQTLTENLSASAAGMEEKAPLDLSLAGSKDQSPAENQKEGGGAEVMVSRKRKRHHKEKDDDSNSKKKKKKKDKKNKSAEKHKKHKKDKKEEKKEDKGEENVNKTE